MQKRLFQRKTIIIIMAIVAVIMLLLVFSESFRETVEDAVLPDESKLSQTHNASRYFFRFGYPDDWVVEGDINGFGFMNDSEKGIVVKAYPKAEFEKINADSEGIMSGAEEDSEESTSIIKSEEVSTVINFFYREISDGEISSSKEACENFVDEFSKAIVNLESGQMAEYEFSEVTEYVADNVTFYCVSYTCEIYKEHTDEGDVQRETLNTVSGEIYVAARSMAYYAINFETELSKKSNEYDSYHKDFINILNDFRFSVFDS